MIILEVPAPKFSIFRHGVMAKTKKKINFSLYFVTMLFCNTISLHSNSHGFSSREVGWGRDTLPPPAANILLITSYLKIFSLYQRFILPSLIGNFHKNFILKPPKNYIFGCSHCTYTNFLSFNFILFLHTVGHANLDFNS